MTLQIAFAYSGFHCEVFYLSRTLLNATIKSHLIRQIILFKLHFKYSKWQKKVAWCCVWLFVGVCLSVRATVVCDIRLSYANDINTIIQLHLQNTQRKIKPRNCTQSANYIKAKRVAWQEHKWVWSFIFNSTFAYQWFLLEFQCQENRETDK